MSKDTSKSMRASDEVLTSSFKPIYESISHRDYRTAVDLCRDSKVKGYPLAKVLMARCYALSDMIDEAKDCVVEAMRDYKPESLMYSDPDFLSAVANVYNTASEFSSTVALYDKALKFDPSNEIYQRGQIFAYMQQQDWKKMQLACMKLSKINSRYSSWAALALHLSTNDAMSKGHGPAPNVITGGGRGYAEALLSDPSMIRSLDMAESLLKMALDSSSAGSNEDDLETLCLLLHTDLRRGLYKRSLEDLIKFTSISKDISSLNSSSTAELVKARASLPGLDSDSPFLTRSSGDASETRDSTNSNPSVLESLRLAASLFYMGALYSESKLDSSSASNELPNDSILRTIIDSSNESGDLPIDLNGKVHLILQEIIDFSGFGTWKSAFLATVVLSRVFEHQYSDWAVFQSLIVTFVRYRLRFVDVAYDPLNMSSFDDTSFSKASQQLQDALPSLIGDGGREINNISPSQWFNSKLSEICSACSSFSSNPFRYHIKPVNRSPMLGLILYTGLAASMFESLKALRSTSGASRDHNPYVNGYNYAVSCYAIGLGDRSCCFSDLEPFLLPLTLDEESVSVYFSKFDYFKKIDSLRSCLHIPQKVSNISTVASESSDSSSSVMVIEIAEKSIFLPNGNLLSTPLRSVPLPLSASETAAVSHPYQLLFAAKTASVNEASFSPVEHFIVNPSSCSNADIVRLLKTLMSNHLPTPETKHVLVRGVTESIDNASVSQGKGSESQSKLSKEDPHGVQEAIRMKDSIVISKETQQEVERIRRSIRIAVNCARFIFYLYSSLHESESIFSEFVTDLSNAWCNTRLLNSLFSGGNREILENDDFLFLAAILLYKKGCASMKDVGVHNSYILEAMLLLNTLSNHSPHNPQPRLLLVHLLSVTGNAVMALHHFGKLRVKSISTESLGMRAYFSSLPLFTILSDPINPAVGPSIHSSSMGGHQPGYIVSSKYFSSTNSPISVSSTPTLFYPQAVHDAMLRFRKSSLEGLSPALVEAITNGHFSVALDLSRMGFRLEDSAFAAFHKVNELSRRISCARDAPTLSRLTRLLSPGSAFCVSEGMLLRLRDNSDLDIFQNYSAPAMKTHQFQWQLQVGLLEKFFAEPNNSSNGSKGEQEDLLRFLSSLTGVLTDAALSDSADLNEWLVSALDGKSGGELSRRLLRKLSMSYSMALKSFVAAFIDSVVDVRNFDAALAEQRLLNLRKLLEVAEISSNLSLSAYNTHMMHYSEMSSDLDPAVEASVHSLHRSVRSPAFVILSESLLGTTLGLDSTPSPFLVKAAGNSASDSSAQYLGPFAALKYFLPLILLKACEVGLAFRRKDEDGSSLEKLAEELKQSITVYGHILSVVIAGNSSEALMQEGQKSGKKKQPAHAASANTAIYLSKSVLGEEFSGSNVETYMPSLLLSLQYLYQLVPTFLQSLLPSSKLPAKIANLKAPPKNVKNIKSVLNSKEKDSSKETEIAPLNSVLQALEQGLKNLQSTISARKNSLSDASQGFSLSNYNSNALFKGHSVGGFSIPSTLLSPEGQGPFVSNILSLSSASGSGESILADPELHSLLNRVKGIVEESTKKKNTNSSATKSRNGNVKSVHDLEYNLKLSETKATLGLLVDLAQSTDNILSAALEEISSTMKLYFSK